MRQCERSFVLSLMELSPTTSSYTLKRQIFKLVGSNFFIYESSGALAFFVHQKGFKLKEDITVYGDEAKSNPLFAIRARQVFDFSASYDLVDLKSNATFGVLKRKGWASMARDEWLVCDANEVQFATLIEDSLILALVRRLLSGLVPQNYDMLSGNDRIADFKQNFNPFSYHLNVDLGNWPNSYDRRVAIASAILLAAIEGRQS